MRQVLHKHAGVTLLGLVWVLIAVWQVLEHQRLDKAQRLALLTRARDIATSMEVVIRSQSRRRAIAQARIEEALAALVGTSDLLAVALVNPGDEVIAAAGPAFPAAVAALPPGTTTWTSQTLTVVQLVQFGDRPGATSLEETDTWPGTEPGGTPPRNIAPESTAPDIPAADGNADTPSADSDGQPRRRGSGMNRQLRGRRAEAPDAPHQQLQEWFGRYALRGEQPAFPPWLTERDFRERFETHGLRKFVMLLSTADLTATLRRDAWQRATLALVALLACGALAQTWRSLQRATCLQVGLVRAQELNEHLRDMNAAAAGLAHETRNPLNVVRGLAQLIAAEADDPAASRERADRTIEEVDRVTSRLNEFIDYSRPREPRLEAVRLDSLVADVARTLEPDREEKDIGLEIDIAAEPVAADPGQLRQVLFNLLLNACQALPQHGQIRVYTQTAAGGVQLCVSDNGPGIPEAHREDVFRAYVSLSERGSGLGLAVVRQIVLQHHWDILCRTSAEGGAEFVVSGIQPAAPGVL